MNKGDLVEKIASEVGLTKRASSEAVGAITSVITEALARGEKATLVGFGAFQVMERKARRGKNPQTGQTIEVPAKKVPKFKAGRGLGEAVR